MQADLPVIKEEFNENTEKEIHEKYLKDLMVKYKYSISDLNEKIIITTEDTKKVICDIIMENTLFNIISESVYGEIDLTVKPRIYFFMGKENEINLKDENLRRSAGLIKNSYNGNLEQNMDNKLIESEMKEEEKVENIIKEETENNKSLGSKNIEKSAVSNN